MVKIKFGRSSDLAIAGDWDGDGRTDVGVRRSSDGTFWPRMPDGSAHPVWLGDSDDLPVTGDWDGDGRTDLGVFDQATATFTLRTVGADGRVFLTVRQFGAAGDLPVVADWDGDGSTDLGVWSPTTAVLTQAVSEPVVNARSVAIPRRTLKVGRPRR